MTLTFQIDLTADGNTFITDSEKETFAKNRLAMLPDRLTNQQSYKHGDTFTLHGEDAVYLRDLVQSGFLPFVAIL